MEAARDHKIASLWKYKNRSERELYESLKRIDAQDLSSHLYNAHALKQRVRSSNVHADQQQARRGQQKSAGEDSEHKWAPGPAWTGWPLETHGVPRSQRRFSEDAISRDSPVDGVNLVATPDSRPSSDLEDALLAEVLKQACQKLRLRDASNDNVREVGGHRRKRRKLNVDIGDAISGVATKDQEPEEKTENIKGSPDGQIDNANASSTSKSPLFALQSGAVSTVKSTQDSGHDNADKETFGIQETLTHGSDNDRIENFTPRRLFQSDDEQAHKLLQPLIRRGIRSLDQLLMNLHHSRANHIENSAYDESSDSGLDSSGRSRGSKRYSPRSRRLSSLSSSSGIRPNRRSTSAWTLKNLRTRNWSEVLSTARVSGWSADAVQAAASRCSQIFEETIDVKISAGNVRGDSSFPIRETGIFCHCATCAVTGKVFPSQRSKEEHLRRVHAEEGLPEGGNVVETPSPNPVLSEPRVSGFDVADDFLAPVEIRPKWKIERPHQKYKGRGKRKISGTAS